jgi:hypothetical protein
MSSAGLVFEDLMIEKRVPKHTRNNGNPTTKGLAPQVIYKGQLETKAKTEARPK